MKIIVKSIAHHRNGICGAPFHVVTFSDKENKNLIAVVFPELYHTAVLSIDLLPCIAFGFNSFRGDHYEFALRDAIKVWELSQ